MGVGIAMIIAAIVSAVVGVGASVATNKANQSAVDSTNQANIQATKENNATNLQAVRETNAANVEQANLAYERSKPATQIANLMGAGMSRQAAIQSLSGGGSYTAPTLEIPNSQAVHADAPHFDYSGIAQAMQQLGNIPSNVAQQQITDQHLADLKQQADIRQKQELREQEKHDFDMWRERYGKRTAELLDGVASKVVQAASLRGYDLSSAKSVQNIMRDLNLESDKDYQSMPHLARTQLFDAIKSQNDQRIAQEQHEANIRESEDKHELSILERQKVQDAITEGRAHFNQWKNESNARQKELRVRDLAADLQKLRTEIGLADEDANSFLFYVRDHDGNLKKDEIAKQLKTGVEMFDAFWQGFFKIIPLNALSKTLLGDLIKIGI